jgi:hypothetical protein
MEQKQGETSGARQASMGMKPQTSNPRTLGKLRSGRDDNRPTEDDIAKQHMGPRGLPGEPAPQNALPEDETQIPKGLDPGHTA